MVCQSACRSVIPVSPAEKAEPIEMPFGIWALIGPMNHVLDGGPQVLRHVAMATNFWLSTSYNFGCMFDSRGGFSGSSYTMKTQPRLKV